ncbi:MAG: ABC transporter substrate-binding protein [Thermoprotei archaeon]|nr:MAG: ABC transporter substrate-binding protein [Thermoprotei archaeon]
MRKTCLVGILVALLILAPIISLIHVTFAAPEEVPYGPWVDEIAFFEEKDKEKAVDMMKKGEMHVYLFPIEDPDLFARVKASPELTYKMSFGLFYEFTLNPAEFKEGKGFNPFVNPRIREAINYIIDREYIADEICRGLAKPKWVSFISAFPEYGRLADVIKLIEAKYSYNFEKGKEIIFEEMMEMGCEYKDGKWYYKGQPVTIKVIIRVEDFRKQIGDYLCDQLEKLGFTVERLYKTRREAGALVFAGDPTEGLWHIYTGGWVSTAVSRDDRWDFGFFYTPLGYGAFMKYSKPDPIFYEIAERLWRGDFKSWEERQELMAKALELAMKDSLRVWIVDQISPWVSVKDLEAAADLSGGFWSAIWCRTVRFKDKVGGTIKAASVGILVDPWNPVAGTNWVYDALVLWCLNDYAFISNPYTGLPMPINVVNATVYATKEVGATATMPWVKLVVVDKIEAPDDAWWGWDIEKKKVITVGEAKAMGEINGYCKCKVVVNYGSVLGKVKYHDGSVMTLADWTAFWPFGFERALNKDSPLYDESAVPGFKTWRKNFIGRRIISEDPLIIEYYTNYTHQEAEFIVSGVAGWPNIPWHVTAIGILAEEKGLLAFSDYKAKQTAREWMNYIGGPSLAVLKSCLDEALETSYIPFKEFASQYISTEEAKKRYEALKAFYESYGHFWVASGPYYLSRVDFTAHQAVVKAFREYRFKADRFAWLAEPPIPEATIEVPESVVPGLKATFTVKLTYKGKPYPSERIDFVKYLVLDAKGNLITKGEAKFVEEGKYEITLDSKTTGAMTPGTYTLMIVAASKDVALPAMPTKEFVVIPAIEYFQTLLESTKKALESRIGGLETSVSSLESNVKSIQASIGQLTTLAGLSLVLTLVALGLAAFALLKAKKPAEKKE